MASFVKFQNFVQDLGLKIHNLNADTLKILLTNSAPNAATHAVKGDLTEISAGFGYSAGGATVASNAFSQTGGTGKLTGTDPVITASGGSIGPFRYAVLYNDTPTSPADPLIGYWDYGASITLLDGEPLTIDLDGSNGILQIA